MQQNTIFISAVVVELIALIFSHAESVVVIVVVEVVLPAAAAFECDLNPWVSNLKKNPYQFEAFGYSPKIIQNLKP